MILGDIFRKREGRVAQELKNNSGDLGLVESGLGFQIDINQSISPLQATRERVKFEVVTVTEVGKYKCTMLLTLVSSLH